MPKIITAPCDLTVKVGELQGDLAGWPPRHTVQWMSGGLTRRPAGGHGVTDSKKKKKKKKKSSQFHHVALSRLQYDSSLGSAAVTPNGCKWNCRTGLQQEAANLGEFIYLFMIMTFFI